MKPATFFNIGSIGLCALALTACSTMPTPKKTTTTGPTMPAAGAATVANGSYTLQSVTLPSLNQKQPAVIACPSKNVAEKIDCTDNAAKFEGGKYDLGVTIGNPARTGTYAAYAEAANPSLNLQLNGNLVGNWTVVGGQYTLSVTGLSGNFSGTGSLRFPMKFVYSKK